MKWNVKLAGLDCDLEPVREGLGFVLQELPFGLAEDGIPVTVKKGTHLRVQMDKTGGVIEYGTLVEFFRALSHLAEQGPECTVEETSCFDKNGVMFDVSRNAVMTVDAIKYLLCRMALMGLNLAMLYAEDTYEVEGYPVFGYLRGRYSKQELKELDDYAWALGVEMIPCIQTLGHHERILQWGAMNDVRDTDDVLLTGADATYTYLEQILKDASEPFRSKRIHIGMDESTWIGRGKYINQNGYRPAKELMQEHFTRVKEIVDRLGLEAMLWSDMFFSILSSDLEMYGNDTVIPQDLIDAVPDDVQLVYWDYYHDDIETYRVRLRLHQEFRSKTIFAGGVWVWNGPAADYGRTLNNTPPALEACREAGVREVFATAWNDDGGECNMLSTLYGLQIFAEYGYTGVYDPSAIDRRFQATVADPQAFIDFRLFHTHPDGSRNGITQIPSKYLLYEDPLMPLLGDMANIGLREQFAALKPKYEAYRDANPRYALLFDFHAKLANVLALKCEWREQAADIVRAGNRLAAGKLDALAADICGALCEMKEAWRLLWFSTNKPFGFEVIDNRAGAMIARAESARKRMCDFAEGRIETIEELACPKLGTVEADKGLYHKEHWNRIVSPGIV